MAKNEKSSYQDLARNMKSDETEKQEVDTNVEEETEEEGKEGASLEYPSHAEVESQLAKVEAERDDYKNNYLKVCADMENLRRRTEKDISKAHKFALEKFAQELLPVVDSLEHGLAIETNKDQLAEKIHEGMLLTRDMLLKTLEKFYIKQISPEVGEAFNPDWHQAMSTQQDAEAKPNTILTVMQKGYTLHDRVLRPALVVVAAS